MAFIFLRGGTKVENSLVVKSKAFKDSGFIPVKYTGIGEDISIPLEFSDVSSSGKSIAIIMDDPDAPTVKSFVHWLIWNIPIKVNSISENISYTNEIDGAIQGKNDFGKIGYKGPNPPSGVHTYKIKVYVLDSILQLKEGASKESLEEAMKGHIIQTGLLNGKYKK